MNLTGGRRKKLALLLPGYNEELIIAATITSAIAAGLKKEDIYVVDDGSEDKTYKEARKILSKKNILSVVHGGKAKAVQQAIQHFCLVEQYTWLHIADADSVFCADYFKIYKRNLNTKECVAAVGFVQSMRGNWIAHYRAFSYTCGQHIFRRIQSWFGVIAVMPGPVACFQTNVIKHLNFSTSSLTEDLDLTIQIHRKQLGAITFIPEAINFTQDPRTIKDFCKQTMRWHRGFFQAVRKYRLGMRPRLFDFSIGYQVSESLFYFVQLFIFLPLVTLQVHNWRALPIALAFDYLVVCILAVLAALVAKRPTILLSILYFYVLRFLEVVLFFRAFVEVIIVRRFTEPTDGWETRGRRYALDTKALEDSAS